MRSACASRDASCRSSARRAASTMQWRCTSVLVASSRTPATRVVRPWRPHQTTSMPAPSRSSTPSCQTPRAWEPQTSISSRETIPSTCAAASTACCTSCASSPRTRRRASSQPPQDHGHLDIAERRLPQDGRISFELPSGQTGRRSPRLIAKPVNGENITVRMLRPGGHRSTLAALGMGPATTWSRFRELLALQPEGGIAIVTGPTGCGQVDDPLHLRRELNTGDRRKVYTVEDPVEHRIDGSSRLR